MDASKLLAGVRIVPVVVIDDVEKAVPLAGCLLEAGLEDHIQHHCERLEAWLEGGPEVEAAPRIGRLR